MVARNNFNSVATEHAVASEAIRRDTRPLGTRVSQWMRQPMSVASCLAVMGYLIFSFPALSDLVLLTACGLTWWGLRQGEDMPIKLPIQANMIDPKEVIVGAPPMKGKGIFSIGIRKKDGKQIWLTNDDCRQHFLVLGTTGAGKALALDAPVHTPTGWRRLGDLKVGDLVSTPDGRSAPVDGYYPQGELELYEVEFADGRSAEACAEHLWEVRQPGWNGEVEPGERRAHSEGMRLLTTMQVRTLVGRGVRLAVKLPEPVEKPFAEEDEDRYAAGRRIAAGQVSPSMAGGGLEAATHVRTELRFPSGGCVSQRWRLLQGLLDGGGRWDGSENGAVYHALTEAHASEVVDLVRSLGGFARKRTTDDGFEVLIRSRSPSHLFSDPDLCLSMSGEPWGPEEIGIVHVGSEPKRRAQAACIRVDHPDHLFITRDYVVTHNTETLLGFVTNALTWSSGFLFCDGKGDVSLFAKVFAMARRFGREDDLLVLNMMTGNANIGGGGGHLLSNTLNPFSTGSSDNLTQLVVGLMDDAGGDGAMWKGRATAMFTGVMRALTFLRDDNIVDLNVGAIRDHLNLKKIIDLCDATAYPTMPEDIRVSVRSYLTSLPGYQEEKKYRQAQTTLDQHGYLEMQFTKILGSLADVYGHIFKTPYGEIDMQDVVINRRILVVMLPALEKSGDELANLGKIVVATLKGMMGGALGSKIEGSWADIVDNRVTNSPSPFLCVLDEVGYYTVEGLALMAAQARSLGFGMVYASQDIPAMKRLNEKEAASIIANTNTKIFMRTEEMQDTGKLAVDSGGKAIRAETGGYTGYTGEFTTGSRDGMDVRFQSMDAVDTQDLKSMSSGEMLIMYKTERVFGISFYPNPPKVVNTKRLKLRANHFIKIVKPSATEIDSATRLPVILERLISESLPQELEDEARRAAETLHAKADQGDAVAIFARDMSALMDKRTTALQAACASLYSVMSTEAAVADSARQKIRSAQSIADDLGPRAASPRAALAEGAGAEARQPPKGRPSAFQDVPPGLIDPDDQAIPEDLDFDSLPSGPADHYDPLDFADDHPPAQPAPPRGPRRPAVLREDAEHVLSIDERTFDTASRIDANDAVLRVLADLDYDPNRSTVEEVEKRIEEASGAPTDPTEENMAEPEDIDHTAYAASVVADDGANQPPPVPQSEQTFISNILAELLQDDD